MSLYLSQLLLDDDCPVPTDVVFSIPEGNGNVIIKAHKVILACSSPVLKTMLFGSLKKEDNTEIVIKDTTNHAFDTMITFIYQKSVAWENVELEQLFDIGYLAEKYDIPLLKKEVREKIEIYPISQPTVIKIATVGFQFKYLDISDGLLFRCANYLGSSLKTKKDILKLASEYSATEHCEMALKLLAMMNDTDKVCDNCEATPCRTNNVITDINVVRLGLKFKYSHNIFGLGWMTQTLEISGYDETRRSFTLRRRDGDEKSYPVFTYCYFNKFLSRMAYSCHS